MEELFIDNGIYNIDDNEPENTDSIELNMTEHEIMKYDGKQYCILWRFKLVLL